MLSGWPTVRAQGLHKAHRALAAFFQAAFAADGFEQRGGIGKGNNARLAGGGGKIARGELADAREFGFQAVWAVQPQRGAVGFKELPGLVVAQMGKLDFEIEAAQRGLVEIGHQIGGGNENAGVVFHLGEHFVYLGNFPVLPRRAAVLQKAVHFVEQQHRFFAAGFVEGLGDQRFGFADVFGQQIGAALVN